eukprot:406239-Pyramimonas_sp.AAC.1
MGGAAIAVNADWSGSGYQYDTSSGMEVTSNMMDISPSSRARPSSVGPTATAEEHPPPPPPRRVRPEDDSYVPGFS